MLETAALSPAGRAFLGDPVDRNVLIAQISHDGALVVALPSALIEAEGSLVRVEVAPKVDFGIWQDESGPWWPLPAPPPIGRHRLQGSRNLDRLDDILLTLLLSPTAETADHAGREPGFTNIRAYLAARPDDLWTADRSELDRAVRG